MATTITVTATVMGITEAKMADSRSERGTILRGKPGWWLW